MRTMTPADWVLLGIIVAHFAGLIALIWADINSPTGYTAHARRTKEGTRQ